MNHKISLLVKYIALVGTSVEAARRLGVSANTISSWTTGRHDMRPIYFDHLRNKYDEATRKHSTSRDRTKPRSKAGS